MPIALAIGLVTVQPASAREATRAEVQRLAVRAPEDTDALERLRAIDVVDGHPVELDEALATDDAEELRERLEALSGEATSTADPDSIRQEASDVLSHESYADPERTEAERGFVDRVLDRIGDWLAGVLRWMADRFQGVAGGVPGGRLSLWVILLAGVCLLAWIVASRLAGQTQLSRDESALRRRREERDDPTRLDDLAEKAEKRGELELALRLRFRAGVLRLAERGAVPNARSMTSGQIARRLRSKTFDDLALRFDIVVYGKEVVRLEDVEGSRLGWERLWAEVA